MRDVISCYFFVWLDTEKKEDRNCNHSPSCNNNQKVQSDIPRVCFSERVKDGAAITVPGERPLEFAAKMCSVNLDSLGRLGITK